MKNLQKSLKNERKTLLEIEKDLTVETNNEEIRLLEFFKRCSLMMINLLEREIRKCK